VFIAVWPWGAYLGEDALENGVRIKIASWRRNSQNALPSSAKATGQYINGVLAKIEKELVASGLTMADVVTMNVFMVGDPAKGGGMDFGGLMKSYSRYFGAASQGNLPARTTVQVVALPVPGALVEIEVVAAR